MRILRPRLNHLRCEGVVVEPILWESVLNLIDAVLRPLGRAVAVIVVSLVAVFSRQPERRAAARRTLAVLLGD